MESVFKPTEDLIVNNVKPLQEFGTEPEELLIFQCPISRVFALSQFLDNDDWNNFEVVVSKDMNISGSLETSAGKEIDLVSSASQGADAIVYLPSDDGSKLVEKVFQQVSLVCFPEPKEMLEKMKAKTRQKLVGAAKDSAGKNSDPTRSSRHKSGLSVRHSASTRSNKEKSMYSGHTETPKSSKRKHSESSSGKHRSSTSTVSGSSDRSGKSKKKLKKEE
ncbi:Mediator-associated protein 2 [Cardamine amara subsp. amara]|uniref:Mediator-associated protein 2 n=1 Tax=Cardamine amara subsp. amara TaxID=228776 RepID=A0ABD1BAR6_CARAN